MKGFRGGAGALQHRVTFQKRPDPETQTSMGTPSEDWPADPALTNVPAAYEVIGTREFPEAQKRFAETVARFRIRYRAGITPANHRAYFIHDKVANISQTFNITGVYPFEGGRVELIVEVSEIK